MCIRDRPGVIYPNFLLNIHWRLKKNILPSGTVIAIKAVPTYWKPSLKIKFVWDITVKPEKVAAVAAKKKTQEETFLFAN